MKRVLQTKYQSVKSEILFSVRHILTRVERARLVVGFIFVLQFASFYFDTVIVVVAAVFLFALSHTFSLFSRHVVALFSVYQSHCLHATKILLTTSAIKYATCPSKWCVMVSAFHIMLDCFSSCSSYFSTHILYRYIDGYIQFQAQLPPRYNLLSWLLLAIWIVGLLYLLLLLYSSVYISFCTLAPSIRNMRRFVWEFSGHAIAHTITVIVANALSPSLSRTISITLAHAFYPMLYCRIT